MKQQDIHILIERFLDAETTLQEEQQLMEYFNQEDIPEELMQYREMFLDYEALATAYSPDEKEPVYTPATTITTIELSRKKRPPRIILWAVAASIALLIAVGAGFLYNINKVEETPQLAKAEPQPEAIKEKENKPEALIAEAAKTTKEKQPKKTPSPTSPSKMEIEQPSQQSQLAQVDNENTQQTNDEERQIAEIMRRQEERLLAMQQEMSQTDIRAEITLRGERMRQAHAIFASIEY